MTETDNGPDFSVPVIIAPPGAYDENGKWRPPKYTLAPHIIWWCQRYLCQPDGPDAGKPWKFTQEQARFLAWFYAVDDNGRFLFPKGMLQRLKGGGKDPLGGVIAAVEFIGPCRFGGFDPEAPGGVIAVPHGAPWVQIAAVSKEQTKNTMTLFPRLFSPRAIEEYGLDIGKEVIYSRTGGRLESVTSSPATLEGARASFVLKNETHLWKEANEGIEMANVIDRNLVKSRDGSARSLAITNAHMPGEGSDAEREWNAYQDFLAGKLPRPPLMVDSRSAHPDIDLADDDQLRAGVIAARGDAVWLDVDRIMMAIRDPSTPPSQARRFYLNQIVAAEDSWISAIEWTPLAASEKVIGNRDAIVLGFDGSRKRENGFTDATALIACRVSDGHIFPIDIWEPPAGPAAVGWEVPVHAVEAAVQDTFRRYNVVGFYADPAKWEGFIADWEAKYGPKLKVKVSQQHPISFWMTGTRSNRVIRALDQFKTAVLNRELTHNGDYRLTQHILNARQRLTPRGITISKENPESPRKIDAAVAAVLAWQARLDALSRGLTAARSRRIRRY